MKQNLFTNTGRGLKWALIGEVVTAVFCVAALLTHVYVKFIFAAFTVGGLIGVVSILRMWRGQEEFGPAHRRQTRRGSYAFLLASILFVLALFSFNTFTSTDTTNGLPDANNTTAAPPTHRFKDLDPPIVLLGAAIIAEASSGALLLYELVGDAWRRMVQGYAALGVFVGVGLVVQGIRIVSALQREAGAGQLDTLQQAQSYFDRFLDEFLPVFLGGFLIIRCVAYILVRHAIEKVAEAERDAANQPAPDEPAPPA